MQILMGPLDSTEQINSASRKDGSCKYHTHNLPAAQFGPGVYELGVTAPSWSQVPNSKRSRTLKTEDVIPVYIGQAANIRQRLQKYGQAGAQLEHGSRYCKQSIIRSQVLNFLFFSHDALCWSLHPEFLISDVWALKVIFHLLLQTFHTSSWR